MISNAKGAANAAVHFSRQLWTHRYGSSLLVALAIEALLGLVHHTPLVQAISDAGGDWLVRLHRGDASAAAAGRPTVWIDIDEESFAKWGYPRYVPPAKIASLLRFALSGQPALLVVDINLSHAMSAEEIADLRDAFTAHDEAARRVPIILARSLPYRWEIGFGSVKSIEPSPLDAAVKAIPQIHWASFVFDRDGDWTIRRWRLWDVICPAGKPQLIPSIPLVAAASLRGGNEGVDALETLLRAEAELADKKVCSGDAGEEDSLQDRRTLGLLGLKLGIPATEIEQRLMFTLPWHLGDGERWPSVLGCNRAVPILTRLSAYSIADVVEAAEQADTEMLCGAIVVVGGSFAEGRDFHRTPLGDMPGSLVVANSILSVLWHGQMHAAGWYVRGALFVGGVLLMAWVFTQLSSFWALILSAFLVLSIMIPVSVWLLSTGVWLDFTVPLVAVFMHNLAKQFEQSIERRHAT